LRNFLNHRKKDTGEQQKPKTDDSNIRYAPGSAKLHEEEMSREEVQ
jgi:hypothetical protein